MHVAYESYATFVRIECRLFIIKYHLLCEELTFAWANRLHIISFVHVHYVPFAGVILSTPLFLTTLFSLIFDSVCLFHKMNIFVSARVRRMFQLVAFDCEWLSVANTYIHITHFWKILISFLCTPTESAMQSQWKWKWKWQHTFRFHACRFDLVCFDLTCLLRLHYGK